MIGTVTGSHRVTDAPVCRDVSCMSSVINSSCHLIFLCVHVIIHGIIHLSDHSMCSPRDSEFESSVSSSPLDVIVRDSLTKKTSDRIWHMLNKRRRLGKRPASPASQLSPPRGHEVTHYCTSMTRFVPAFATLTND